MKKVITTGANTIKHYRWPEKDDDEEVKVQQPEQQ